MKDEITYLTDINLYDLAGEDWYVLAKESTGFGYDLTLINEDEDKEVNMRELHPVALASLAKTCKKLYEAIEKLNIED